MAKKSFKDNPALQFITVPEEAPAAPEKEMATAPKGKGKAPGAPKADPAPAAASEGPERERSNIDAVILPIPLSDNISLETLEPLLRGGNPKQSQSKEAGEGRAVPATHPVPDASAAPGGLASAGPGADKTVAQFSIGGPSAPPMKLNPMYIETRSKRVQLLMQPTLHTRLKELAVARGQSLNDFVHEVLERAAEEG